MLLPPLTVILLLGLGAPAAADGVAPLAATYRDGVVTTTALDEWTCHRVATAPATAKLSPGEHARELVLLRVLAARCAEDGLTAAPASSFRVELVEWELAGRWLRRRLMQQASPGEGEAGRVYRSDPARFTHPRRWRLEGIFKRWPENATEAEQDALRRDMAALRVRILGGEDFAAMAAAESESQTRLRGGRMGMVALDDLKPEVAAVVEDLTPGDLSEVVEASDGLHLLRCTMIREAYTESLAEARDRIEERLLRERFTAAWQALDARIAKESRLQPAAGSIGAEAGPETTVASFRLGADTRSLRLDEYAVFLGRRGIRRPPHELSQDEHREQLGQLVLLGGRAAEAAARGLGEDAEHARTLRLRRLEVEARIALDAAVAARLAEPEAEAVRELFRSRQAELVEPERLHLLALQMTIDRELPEAYYERARRLGEAVAAGEAPFAHAEQALAPHAQTVDLGWRTRKQLWALGRNVEHAIRDLEPGQSTALVQEGRTLRLLHLVAQRPERQLTYDEARPRLRKALLDASRLRLEEQLRQETLAEQQVEVCP
jgi:hypothetical protein